MHAWHKYMEDPSDECNVILADLKPIAKIAKIKWH